MKNACAEDEKDMCQMMFPMCYEMPSADFQLNGEMPPADDFQLDGEMPDFKLDGEMPLADDFQLDGEGPAGIYAGDIHEKNAAEVKITEQAKKPTYFFGPSLYFFSKTIVHFITFMTTFFTHIRSPVRLLCG